MLKHLLTTLSGSALAGTLLIGCGGGGGGGSDDIVATPTGPTSPAPPVTPSGPPEPAACFSGYEDRAQNWERFEDLKSSVVYNTDNNRRLMRYRFSRNAEYAIHSPANLSSGGTRIHQLSNTGRYLIYTAPDEFNRTATNFHDLWTFTERSSSVSLGTGFVRTEYRFAPNDASYVRLHSTSELLLPSGTTGNLYIGSPVNEDELTFFRMPTISAVAWSKNSEVVVGAGTNAAYVYSAMTGEALHIMAIEAEEDTRQFMPQKFALSPDGAELAYVEASSGTQTLYLYDLASGTTDRVASATPSGDLTFSWSGSGKYLALSLTNETFQRTPAVYSLRDKTLDVLAPIEHKLIEIAWAPDRDYLSYAVNVGNDTHRLFVHDYEYDRGFSFDTGYYYNFVWSPDSRYLGIIAEGDSSLPELFTADPANVCYERRSRVHRDSGNTFSWSPSSRYIFYWDQDAEGDVIYTITTPDGSDSQNLNPLLIESDRREVSSYGWFPDSDSLFFAARVRLNGPSPTKHFIALQLATMERIDIGQEGDFGNNNTWRVVAQPTGPAN